MRYIFKAEKSSDKLPCESAKIRGIHDDMLISIPHDTEILVLGQLKTRFGEPLYISENYEEQFSYCISATSENGAVTYLSVYSGSTGPSIGGNSHEEQSQMAADALAAYICRAKPSDYDYKGYYLDCPEPILICEGIKNGTPYSSAEVLSLSPEELESLYNRVCGGL